jgi:hypothetical protein
MNKAIMAKIVFVIALAGMVGGCNREEKDRQAIIKVLQSRMDARDKSTAFVRTPGKQVRTLDLPHVLHHLKQIETADCPDEFRTAWLAYIQAWERYASPSSIERRQKQILASPTSRSMGGNLEGHAGLGSGVGGGLSAHYDSTHENNAKLAEFLDREDTSEAFRVVESVALKYNVDALKYE